MTVDITKLTFFSETSSFKNNNVWTGNFTISGNHTDGLNTKTFTRDLGVTPDMVSIQFNAPADPLLNDPRPANGWFRQGVAYEPSPDGGGGFPAWTLTSAINGTVLTITATYVQQYTGTYTSVPTLFSYRVIDYSIF